MNMRVGLLLRTVLFGAGALAIAGCVHRSHHPHGGPPGHHPDGPPGHRAAEPVRVVEPVHSHPEPDHHDCHDGCDHHWDGVRFVVVVGHRHGHGCGHERANNRWVVARVVVNDGPGNNGRGNGNGNGRGRR